MRDVGSIGLDIGVGCREWSWRWGDCESDVLGCLFMEFAEVSFIVAVGFLGHFDIFPTFPLFWLVGF